MHKNYKTLDIENLRCLECIRITTLDVKSKMSKMHCLHVKSITLVQKVNLYIRIYVVNLKCGISTLHNVLYCAGINSIDYCGMLKKVLGH